MTHKSAVKKETARKRLGEIFVEKGLINEVTLERTLERSHHHNSKLGITLENIGLITGDELIDALSCQYGYRVVKDFAKYRYAKDLLQLVPAEIAAKNLLFPLKIDAGRLAIAMADLTEIDIANTIATSNQLKLIPFIATSKDIKAAVERHYSVKHITEDQVKQKTRTILLADDDRLTYTILKNILTKNGYRVVIAPDGMEAYNMVLKEWPDVIISDKVMPKMDGYALQAALHRLPETKNIPMIMISSSNNSNEEASAFERGFFDYLSKPIRETTLLVRVERALAYAEK